MRLTESPCTRAALPACLLVATLFAAMPAWAQDTAAAAAPRNVYAAGGQVRPAGPVQRDFVAVGGRVIVDQPVGGDASVAGGAVDVRAPVAEDVRAAGGDVSIESSIGGELLAAGANVEVRPTARVSGAARLYGANVAVNGPVDGDLLASGRKVTINSAVRGNVHLAAEDIELGPAASIAGTLSYASASELKKAAGATVAGAITREEDRRPAHPARPARERSSAGFWAGGVFSYVALLACAAVFLAVAPVFGAEAPLRIRRAPWSTLGLGFAVLLAVPAMAVLLLVTVLGIPLGLLVMALYPVLLLAGFVVGVLFLATLLPPALRRPAPARLGGTLGWFALALLLMLLLARVPFAGALAMGAASLAGLGACVLEFARRRKRPPPAGEAVPAEGRPDAAGDFPRHA